MFLSLLTLKTSKDCSFERSISIILDQFFCQIGDFHFLTIRLLFPSVMSLLYGGSFSSVFKMFKQRVYEIDNDAWSNRGVA